MSFIFGYSRYLPDRSRKKRPRDPNQLASAIVAESVDDEDAPKQQEPESEKDPHAVALGRKGGLKGGKARAAKLTPERRKEIARQAAAARWGHDA